MMTAVFLKILNMSITAGWIVLAVMLLRLLLRRMPKQFTCMLWGLVGLRLILPFSPESIFSLIPSAETVPQTLQPGEFPEIHSGVTAIDRVVNPAAKYSFSRLPLETSGADAMEFIMHSAILIWFAGMSLMLFYLVFSYLHLQRKMRTSVLFQDNIRQSDCVHSPFILGLIKPRIYIPFRLKEDVLSHVLAHEKAHLARKDHLTKAFAFLLLSVYWFHPLIWAAYLLLCRDIELACDERVIRNLGEEERKSYLLSLIGYDREENRKKIPALACPLAFGEVDLKGRIIRAKTWKKPAFILILLTAAVCVIAALCLLTDPKERLLTAPEPFGHPYLVESIVYTAPQYDFSYTPETAPLYILAGDYQLMESADTSLEGGTPEDQWISCGTAQKIRLTRKNFANDMDIDTGSEQNGFFLSSLLKGNKEAWIVNRPLQEGQILYYILLQKNGDVYLCYGYPVDEVSTDAAKKAKSVVRRIFKLSVMKEETLSVKTLFSHRTKYIGDNSAVGNIIYNLTYPQDMAYRQFALRTDDSEPYAVTITFALSEEDKEQYGSHGSNRQKEAALLQKNACIMFSLIENAQIVNYKLVDETDETKRPLTLVYTRQWAESETACSLWAESETTEQFEALLILLAGHFSTHSQSASRWAQARFPPDTHWFC